MGIGVRYDDGSGSMRPLASYKGMASPWGTSAHSINGGNFAQRRVSKAASFGFVGQSSGRKSIMDKLRERREEKKSLDKSDPRNCGKVLGAQSNPHPLEADNNSRDANDHSPWGRAVMTGLHFEREAPTGRIIVWSYLRTDRFTGEGRCFEMTGETKVPVFSFYPGEGGEGVPSNFDIVTDENDETIKKVTRCSIPCPISVVSCSDYIISGHDPIYLHVDRSSTGYALSVDQTHRADSSSHAEFKLYELDEDGNPTLDCRPTALPLFAF